MKRNEWVAVIAVVIVVAIIASFLTAKLTGNVIGGSYTVSANSCDADSICEVAKTVSTQAGSTSALMLTSDVKKVIVDGSLSAGSVFINGKTVSTNVGSTSALMLTSDVKKVIVDGSLSATKLAGTGNAYACVDSTGNLYRSLTACK